jgi:hypothetical protein
MQDNSLSSPEKCLASHSIYVKRINFCTLLLFTEKQEVEGLFCFDEFWGLENVL